MLYPRTQEWGTYRNPAPQFVRARKRQPTGVIDWWHRIVEAASFRAWVRRQAQKIPVDILSGTVVLSPSGDESMPIESYLDRVVDQTYWSHVTDAASVAAFQRDEDPDALISAEALPENSSLLDFKSFAREYPEKLFPLIDKLRIEFQELFIEYYLLEKSQYFMAKVHGQIQTRIWQNLRIIEQAVGSMIVLGTNPGADILRPILIKAGVETTEYGSLTDMILLYAKTQSYAAVAKQFGSPVPAVRKIFRPVIAQLLESKTLREAAVGSYLRSLTHQSSLTGAGLSKRCRARLSRVRKFKFVAPPSDDSPLLNFGTVSSLHSQPWNMFEISSEHRMNQIFPVLKSNGKKLFGKKSAQIFAPVDSNGELELGYILARTNPPALARTLTRVRGISEMSATYTDEGVLIEAVTVPHEDVQKIIDKHSIPVQNDLEVNQFVEILTGDAARYCGTVTEILGDAVSVEVIFPSGRQFIVRADRTAVKLLVDQPHKRAFWGARL
jgi:hypothetical protein